MCKIPIFIICILLVCCFSLAHSQVYYKDADTLSEDYGAGFGEIGYMYNSNSEEFDFSIGVGQLLDQKKVEFRGSFMSFSAVKRDSDKNRVGIQLPLQLTFFGIGYLIEKGFYKNTDTNFLTSNHLSKFIAFLPKSSLSFRLARNNYIGLSTHTDLLLYRIDGLDRGILFTPAIGYSITKEDHLTGVGGITLSLSYSMFWNFEGENKVDGIGVKLAFYGDATSH